LDVAEDTGAKGGDLLESSAVLIVVGVVVAHRDSVLNRFVSKADPCAPGLQGSPESDL